MGADFIYSTLPAFKITHERLEKLQALLEAATKADLDDGGRFLDGDEGLERAKSEGWLALEWLEEIGRRHNREVSSLYIAGKPYTVWLTGGLSWGETPTEAMDHMDVLGQWTPLWDQIKAWALEDGPES